MDCWMTEMYFWSVTTRNGASDGTRVEASQSTAMMLMPTWRTCWVKVTAVKPDQSRSSSSLSTSWPSTSK